MWSNPVGCIQSVFYKRNLPVDNNRLRWSGLMIRWTEYHEYLSRNRIIPASWNAPSILWLVRNGKDKMRVAAWHQTGEIMQSPGKASRIRDFEKESQYVFPPGIKKGKDNWATTMRFRRQAGLIKQIRSGIWLIRCEVMSQLFFWYRLLLALYCCAQWKDSWNLCMRENHEGANNSEEWSHIECARRMVFHSWIHRINVALSRGYTRAVSFQSFMNGVGKFFIFSVACSAVIPFRSSTYNSPLWSSQLVLFRR
jgi:hypothetical protein